MVTLSSMEPGRARAQRIAISGPRATGGLEKDEVPRTSFLFRNCSTSVAGKLLAGRSGRNLVRAAASYTPSGSAYQVTGTWFSTSDEPGGDMTTVRGIFVAVPVTLLIGAGAPGDDRVEQEPPPGAAAPDVGPATTPPPVPVIPPDTGPAATEPLDTTARTDIGAVRLDTVPR
jgi:hypothetical protein